jgi:hypothetical protein
VSFTTRMRVYVVVGASAVFVWISCIIWDALHSKFSPTLMELVLTFVTAGLAWGPQGIVVFGVTTYVLERRRRKQVNSPTARESLVSHDKANGEP